MARHSMTYTHHHIYETKQKSYGLLDLLFDFFMIALTSGLWLIWVFFREMRRR